jgi:hypothetical protein
VVQLCSCAFWLRSSFAGNHPRSEAGKVTWKVGELRGGRYVVGLDGAVRVLSGSEIVEAEQGDVIVVPPRMPHAFSTQRGTKAELLIVIAPGVERFEYFRQLTRIGCGEEPPESLHKVQEIYDTYFLNSPEWEAARAK